MNVAGEGAQISKADAEGIGGDRPAAGHHEPAVPARSSSINAVLFDLARKATGFTGADVEQAVRTARGTARRERRPLTMQDVEAALIGGRPQLGPALRRRFAVHEAGHAVVAQALNLGKVVSVSIDGVNGGTTVIGRNLDRDQDEAYFTDELVFTMAGRAAETILLGSVGAGSGALRDSDLDRATRLAAALEGSMGYGGSHPLIFHAEDGLRIRLINDHEFADHVHERLKAAEQRARVVVEGRSATIKSFAEELWGAGCIEGEAVRRCLMS